jgi:hypothetical protein
MIRIRPICGRNTQADPDCRRNNCDSRKYVAGFRSKGAGAAHAAERPGQPAAAAALHQDEQDQKDPQDRQQYLKQCTHDQSHAIKTNHGGTEGTEKKMQLPFEN